MAGSSATQEPYPLVGFYFSVSFSDISAPDDCKFMEVSGIKMTLGLDNVNAGGDNGSEIVLPGKTTFSDLTLKRGILPSTSQLRNWCLSWLLNDYSTKLEKKTVYLKVLKNDGTPVVVWQFQEAFPYILEIGKLDAMAAGGSAVLVETIVLRYSNVSISEHFS